jgi:hypothetical protein
MDPVDEPQPPSQSGIQPGSKSALIVSAWVVGMPWGDPWYVFSVPFCEDG